MKREDMIHNKPPGMLMRIREMIFGVEDGLVSTTGAVVGIAAGAQDARIVILSGVVLVIVEALSMAAGTHLSAKSERQLIERRIREEEYEIEHHPDHEREELAEMYRQRGFTAEETEILVRRITSDKKLWLEEMMAKELRIGAEQLDETSSAAAIMWIAYTVGGAVPVVPFLFLPVGTASLVAFISSLCALFGIGAWKAKVTGTDVLKGGLEMLLISASAGFMGYVFGTLVGRLTGITPPV
jgi:predicted membrane protein (TIGR00267 family)